MSIDHYKRLMSTMDDYHRDELLKALQKNNFTVAGFNDVRKVSQNHILGAMKRSIKNRECYLKSIIEIYPELKEYDLLKLKDSEYVETLITTKNKQGVIALLMKESKLDDECIEMIINKHLPVVESIKTDKVGEEKLENDKNSIVEKDNSLKEANKVLKTKIKRMTDAMKQQETTIYSQKDNIEKNEREINKLKIEVEKLREENKELYNKIDIEKSSSEKLVQKFKMLQIEQAKKTILIIGSTFKTKGNKQLNLIVKSEEILENINMINLFLDVFYEIWIIENEISSYSLRRNLVKKQQNNNRVKTFKNPAEIKCYIREIDRNGLL